MATSSTPPYVLVIAGHDPSAGAGIHADMEAIRSMGCGVATVITALTVQDTRNVSGFEVTPSRLLVQQAEAVLNDLPIAAIKIGMIGSEENVHAIASLLRKWSALPVVLDPVLVAGGGGALARGNMARSIREHLFPLATLITPNLPEVRELYESGPASAGDLPSIGSMLSSQTRGYLLITGGHGDESEVHNTLWQNSECVATERWPRLEGEYHGSGCTLAAACSGLIARGLSVPEAVSGAQEYTWQTLKNATRPGHGQFVPNRFFWWSQERFLTTSQVEKQ
ncbi:Hydroxymethylpyrimidine kinase [gamma proteobacterium HdN1]|nr:Hydroxymethylpyrimidine kinase [gamma proteobacterium HdN1]